MKTKHTPGPWDYDPYGSHFSFYGKDKYKDYSFRVEFDESMPEKEQLANVHIIAAAPDMLEALQELWLGHNTGIGKEAMHLRFKMASDAIKKALQ